MSTYQKSDVYTGLIVGGPLDGQYTTQPGKVFRTLENPIELCAYSPTPEGESALDAVIEVVTYIFRPCVKGDIGIWTPNGVSLDEGFDQLCRGYSKKTRSHKPPTYSAI